MSQSRVEIKVGAFLLLGLALLAVLAILFSRGAGFYRDTYEIRLTTGNVGGIKRAPACSCAASRSARWPAPGSTPTATASP